jgi:hypothetical protein
VAHRGSAPLLYGESARVLAIEVQERDLGFGQLVWGSVGQHTEVGWEYNVIFKYYRMILPVF